ncbi:MAG: PKD domain-containing protein, partial [Thermoplasmata archaeon]
LEVSLNNFYQTANITSEPDWCGSEKITIRIIDEHGAYIESTARVNVTSVNDPPVFTRTVPNIHMIEGQNSYKFDLAGYFSDADNLCTSTEDTVKWYIEGEDSRYLQVIGENSTSTEMEIVILDTDFFGEHKLELFIEDSHGAKNSKELWLNVTARNDAPVLKNGTVTPDQGTTETNFEFSVIYTDIEGDLPLTVQLILDGVTYSMIEVNITDRDTTDGKLYIYQTQIPDTGRHNYSFISMDAYSAVGIFTSPSSLFVSPVVHTTGDIAGHVQDSYYELGIGSAEVKLLYSADSSNVSGGLTTTSAQGTFTFYNLLPDFYTIEVRKDGYEVGLLENVLVRPGEVLTDAVIKLDRSGGIGVEPVADSDITNVEIEIISTTLKPTAGFDIIFNGTAEDVDGDPLTFYWDFGDGTLMPMGSSVKHNYTAAGTFNVTLTVLDSDGNIATAVRTVVVTPEPVDEAETEVVKESKEDKYGATMWLAGIFMVIVLLCILIPMFVLYSRRRKRAKAAAKKLKALKKQMILKAAAAPSSQLLPKPVGGEHEQLYGRPGLPSQEPTPQDQVQALPQVAGVPAPTPIPTPVPTPEAAEEDSAAMRGPEVVLPGKRPALPPRLEPEEAVEAEISEAEIIDVEVEPEVAEAEIVEIPRRRIKKIRKIKKKVN